MSSTNYIVRAKFSAKKTIILILSFIFYPNELSPAKIFFGIFGLYYTGWMLILFHKSITSGANCISILCFSTLN